ncbi:MAG: hypothetical protein DWQ07_17675 [Chloroflexi bacterium]|nr:MAG: hypothetical protein DWQ07_17675 [Chloroflexota bacterium]
MLKIKTMAALPCAGADLALGRSHLVLLETDKLQELNSSNVVDLVRAEPAGSCTSFHRHTQALDVAPYGLYRIDTKQNKTHYEHSSRIWVPTGVTRVIQGDFDAYIVDGPENAWQSTTLSNIESGDLLNLRLLHTPFGAVVRIRPQTQAFYPGLAATRCLLNPLSLNGSEYLISIAQTSTFSWLFTDGARSRLLYSSQAYHAEAATLAHRLSMARREGIQKRDIQAAVAHIKANADQYVAESL